MRMHNRPPGCLFTCGLKRLPVTDEHNRVVGVLNRIDIIQAIFEDTISF